VCAPLQKDGHGFVQWIGTGFADCVYSEKELVSFYLGLSSILVWCFCQAPQFVENYKRGSVEALSKWFLIIWLSGDVTNLVGAILTNQLPTQQYTAMLFVSLDVLMVGQYGYYILLRDKLVARGWVEKRDAHVADRGGMAGGGGDMEAPLLEGEEGEEEEEEEEGEEHQDQPIFRTVARTLSVSDEQVLTTQNVARLTAQPPMPAIKNKPGLSYIFCSPPSSSMRGIS
jgi:hypothetical protein